MIAHNGSGFDSFLILNNLPQWRSVGNLIKSGACIVLLKKIIGCVHENKKNPQVVHFRYGRVHINNSLKKIGTSYKLQPCLLKQEIEHDEIYEDTWEETKK